MEIKLSTMSFWELLRFHLLRQRRLVLEEFANDNRRTNRVFRVLVDPYSSWGRPTYYYGLVSKRTGALIVWDSEGKCIDDGGDLLFRNTRLLEP
jgi:hypothetical protein